MKNFRSMAPNLITLMNLFCGILAIVSLLLGGSASQSMLFIFLAAVCDLLDGWVARLLSATSPIGADLDSLADVVSFGVAPALLLFLRIYHQWGSLPAAIPALLLPLFTAYRLAKFNNDTRQSEGFLGLPVPSNAFFWIGYISLVEYYHGWSQPIILILSYILVLGMGTLMVSDLPMFSLKSLQKVPPKQWIRSPFFFPLVLILGHSIPALIIWKWGGLAVGILFYITLSIWNFFKKKRPSKP